MGYLYKCNRKVALPVSGKKVVCGARTALPRLAETYAQAPTCRACGALLTYLDQWQMEKNRKDVCRCDGARHPHRKGSIELCKFYDRNRIKNHE